MSSVRALFVKNGQFIRQLHVHSQEMRGIVSASGVCINLRALKIYDPDNKDPGNTYTDPDGNLWDVVRANADLDTLRLGRSFRELLSLRNLEYLTIAGLHDVGQHFGQYVETLLVNTPLRLKGFSAHAPHLEVFRQTQNGESIHFHYKPHPALNVANIFFQTCTKLRVFDGIHHTIDAAKMCEKPWVCHSLEVFRCQIVRS
ncbi:hypothetical protein BGX33_001396 [Mortierella sp. NVP41]|nr:hypothetical protein BGX33_001396 [Mortierella sp. NVP41]